MGSLKFRDDRQKGQAALNKQGIKVVPLRADWFHHKACGKMSDTCAKFSVDLSAYFDGELEAEEEKALKAHLDACDKCRGDLDRMRRIRSAMSGLGRRSHHGPDSVLESLRNKLSLEGKGKKNSLFS